MDAEAHSAGEMGAVGKYSDQGFFAREGGADDADVPRAAHAGGAAWNRCSGLGIGADSCKLRGGWSCGFSALLGKGARFRGLRAA